MSPEQLAALRPLIPEVTGVLVRRGADFASAEDAVASALLRAVETDAEVREPKGWLITTAWHRFIDQVRSDDARRARELADDAEPDAGAVPSADETLHLYLVCTHPALSTSSAIALTLRAVAGLTTRQIAEAYLVPESTMAQRISRAKRTIAGESLGPSGDLDRVLRVLYLVFNEGYAGDVDLVAEALRLTRQLTRLADEPEVWGLLALMMLHGARRPARRDADGRLVTLAEQDRSLWDTGAIAEAVLVLQAALAQDRVGQYQAQAAVAALHADAATFDETDWVQIVEWYDELLSTADTPVARLNRAVAVGHADGAPAGLAALRELDPALPRFTAVEAYLTDLLGEPDRAADLYATAARAATSTDERDHLLRQAQRLRDA